MLRNLTPQAAYLFLLSSLGSCLSTFHIQDDRVKNTKRITITQSHDPMENRSPMLGMEQTMVKLLHREQGIAYEVFDILRLKERSFRLERELYWIIDGDIFEIHPEYMDNEKSIDIVENTKTLMTVDSTEVSVVTGYTENHWNMVKVRYSLPAPVIDKLMTAKELLIRYYAGPEMVTIKVTGSSLRKLKKLGSII